MEHSLQGKTITEVNAIEQGEGPRSGSFDDIIFQGSNSAAEVAAHFLQRKVMSTHRRGKQMWLTLSGEGLQPTFHFGMTGSFAVKGGDCMEYQRYTVDTAVWPPRFCKLELVAEDGTRLALVNSRRLGRVRFFDDPSAHPPISLLGFDPLLSLPSPGAFTAALALRGQAIKAVLLDQSFSAGVGNWIADEVVYQAGVHPSHPCRSLTAEEAARVHGALQSVVHTAVEANADSKKFPSSWLFHFRWAKGATGVRDAHGNPIAFVTVGGRTSAVVAALQGSGKEWKSRDASLHIGGAGKPAKIAHKVAAAAGGGSSGPAVPKAQAKSVPSSRSGPAVPKRTTTPKPKSKSKSKPAKATMPARAQGSKRGRADSTSRAGSRQLDPAPVPSKRRSARLSR